MYQSPPRLRPWTAPLGAVVAALALGIAAPATAVPPGGAEDRANGARVSIDRTTVVQGGRIKVHGTNWKAKGSRLSDRAEVTIKLDDLHILAVLPIRDRRFSGWVRIPRQVAPGRHWLRFLAAEPATSIKSRRFTVTRRRAARR